MKKTFAALICILVIIFSITNIFALTVNPRPIERDLGNGLTFWMVIPRDVELGYPKSGLYQNGELVYAVDVCAGWWLTPLYFSNDPMNFIRIDAGASVRFYEQGIFMHSYDVDSLLRGGRDALIQPRGLDFFPRWDFPNRRVYDRQNNILRVATVENIIISFDLSTGLILSKQRDLTTIFLLIGIGVVVGAGVLVFVLNRISTSEPA